ncbi:hypothetical protein FPE01S_01_18470 [Flavihumibacter petaseus NBRC 106054]|uniref:DUF306 domain-containing protein n=1 Tax=Flavihumibacter petaseus NBRC 106054 TaxID=1220578 RepID=A0A0E9MYZ5_9BACT|nr:hypothetical protein FPE01S_01_18470 [Flavihumibacter petaseus NBRC 106054]
MQRSYAERMEATFVSQGTFRREGNQITLTDNRGDAGRYMVQDNSLIVLDQDGKPVTGALTSKYVLHRQLLANPEKWKAQAANGIDFIAMGTEPFWNVSLREGQWLIFQTPDKRDSSRIPVQLEKAGGTGWTYTGELDGQLFRLAIYTEFSSDGMSDRIYRYRTTFETNGKKLSGTGVALRGAISGNSAGGSWVLQDILEPGKSLQSLFSQKTPTLLIDTIARKLSGSTSCNRFNGAWMNGSELPFNAAQLAMTRMACAGEGETVFLAAFKKVNGFRCIADELLMYQDNRVLLRWKKL